MRNQSRCSGRRGCRSAIGVGGEGKFVDQAHHAANGIPSFALWLAQSESTRLSI